MDVLIIITLVICLVVTIVIAIAIPKKRNIFPSTDSTSVSPSTPSTSTPSALSTPSTPSTLSTPSTPGTPSTGTLSTTSDTLTKEQQEKVSAGLSARTQGQIVRGAAVSGALVGTYVVAKVMKRVLPKVTPKIISRLPELGSRALAKLSPKLATSVGLKAGGKIASRLAEAGAELETPLVVFDIASIGLDVADPGGYMDLTTKETYYKMKKGIDKTFNKAVPEPIIVGPLDKLSQDQLMTKVNDEVIQIMSDPNSKYMKPITDRIKRENATTDEAIDKIIDEESTKMNHDQLAQDALNNICVSLNGRVIGTACSYKDATSCNSSYTWPHLGPNETYAEWDAQKNLCAVAPTGMRSFCDQNKVPYDITTGVCKVDETYCKKKGADWKYNNKIKEFDCHISTGQDVAEFIFGTTVTRGLKQVFNKDQYEKCGSGEQEYGDYMCAVCNSGDEMDGLLCYPACKSGYGSAGPVCWQKCPDDFTDNGAFCLKPKPYGRGVGYPWTFGDDIGSLDEAKKRCEKSKEGEKYGCEKYGLIYYPKCKKGFHNEGCCICSPNCGSMGTDIGISCTKKTYGRSAGYIPTKTRFKKRVVPYGKA